LKGSPTCTAENDATSLSTNWSWVRFGTMIRVKDEHTCPLSLHSAAAMAATVVEMSVSSSTTAALLPPSTRV
jgi:hypothetical protein